VSFFLCRGRPNPAKCALIRFDRLLASCWSIHSGAEFAPHAGPTSAPAEGSLMTKEVLDQRFCAFLNLHFYNDNNHFLSRFERV
jgi:hypothetical protein